MLNLLQNTGNTIALTLREKQTAGSLSLYPYYLFSFKNDFNKEVKNFIATNTFSYPASCCVFTLYLTGTPYQNLTAGTVNLTNGSYTYKIYEQSSNTNTSLSFSGLGNQLETGIVIVESSASTIYNI